MPGRPLPSKERHDQMVRSLAESLLLQGYRDVEADLPDSPEYGRPEEIVWESTGEAHIPDVTALNEQFNLFEVETADSISDDHTADQWTSFATHAQQEEVVFWVVVPSGYRLSAEQRLTDLGIEAEIWEV